MMVDIRLSIVKSAAEGGFSNGDFRPKRSLSLCQALAPRTLTLPIAIRVVYKTSIAIRVEEADVLSKKPPEAGEILQGTRDMLILRTLVMGPAHGHTIAQVIEHTSENALGDSIESAGE
jgi:hypothetical protein